MGGWRSVRDLFVHLGEVNQCRLGASPSCKYKISMFPNTASTGCHSVPAPEIAIHGSQMSPSLGALFPRVVKKAPTAQFLGFTNGNQPRVRFATLRAVTMFLRTISPIVCNASCHLYVPGEHMCPSASMLTSNRPTAGCPIEDQYPSPTLRLHVHMKHRHRREDSLILVLCVLQNQSVTANSATESIFFENAENRVRKPNPMAYQAMCARPSGLTAVSCNRRKG